MLRTVVILFVMLLLKLPVCHAQDFKKLEERIDALIKNGQLPSVAVGILKDGAIVYEKAFGYADLDQKIKSTIHTPYQLASLSKPITATAILKLHEQGVINLDDPISRYISLQKVDPTFPDPTIRQVLNHTAGLGTYFDIFYEDEKIKPIQFKEAWERYGTIFQRPGKVCEYSNLGYGLLDYIIAQKTALTYSGYLKRNVFDQLNMEQSFVIEKRSKSDRQLAQKYRADLNELPAVWNNTPGAGNVASSVHDLLSFAAFHLQNSKTDFLKSSSIRIMQEYQAPNALFHYYQDTYYGLGWYVMDNDQGQKVVWHEGGMMGASTVLKLFPKENLAIVLLTNVYAPPVCRALTDEIATLMIPDYTSTPLNEIAEYSDAASDTTFQGSWQGQMHIEGSKIPISLSIENEGVTISYPDYTLRSFLSGDQPLPYNTKLFMGVVNQNYFLGTGIGELPTSDARKEHRHLLSFKLLREGNQLKGTIVSLSVEDREYDAHPYYLVLEKANVKNK